MSAKVKSPLTHVKYQEARGAAEMAMVMTSSAAVITKLMALSIS